jgi:hypothetical protein
MPETYTDRPLLSNNFDQALLLATEHHRTVAEIDRLAGGAPGDVRRVGE